MKSHCEYGFTLLELLVSLTILALVAILLFPSITLTLQGSQKISAKLTVIRENVTFEKLLRDNLSAALAIKFDQTKRSKIFFTGSAKTIKYLFPGKRGPEKRKIYHWNKEFLVFDKGVFDTRELKFPMLDYQFSYFGKLSSKAAPKWHRSWKVKDRLPQLVRFSSNKRYPITIKINASL
ncbi:MAG: hypothetical protein CMM58_03425 [Rhodospirillaceae bacterium]|nr:hypothetical protein [Rhodospirillaceae bacterium]|tara:strand:- start:1613 stop:2149 length:537 start_codon:yes stop_codon:yes gene_type:complete